MTVADARKRNPVATRASILQAAEKLFVNMGFAATSMSDIARRAGVTKSLIHHHFGSKEDLWDEVKRQRMRHYADVQRQLIGERDDGEAGVLRRSIEAYFHFLRESPEFVRLSVWMNLEDPRLSQMTFPELVTLGVERIQQEQRAGRIRDDVEPRHLVIMFVSLCMYWFMARSTGFSGLVPEDPQEADSAYLDDLLKVFFLGVRPR
jgi:TetR/AcrR family transcriptional regulator